MVEDELTSVVEYFDVIGSAGCNGVLSQCFGFAVDPRPMLVTRGAGSLYEQFTTDPRAFVADFSASLDLVCDQASLDFGRLNVSLSRRRAQLLRRLNFFTSRSVLDKWYYADIEHWYADRWNWLDRLVGPLPTGAKSGLLSTDMRRQIAAHFAEANTRLATEWSLPLAEFGYPVRPSVDESRS